MRPKSGLEETFFGAVCKHRDSWFVEDVYHAPSLRILLAELFVQAHDTNFPKLPIVHTRLRIMYDSNIIVII